MHATESPDAVVDRVLAVAHLGPAAHVAVIEHRTLSTVLALMRRGCACVRSLRPGWASPDGERADLAWIVDAASDAELDDALRAARRRTGPRGRVVVEGHDCACANGLNSIRNRALAAGLDIVAFGHLARRLVLAPAPATRLAA